MRSIAVLALFLVSALFFAFYPLPTPCDSPIPYKLGLIDSRFNVAEEEFLADIAQAERSWESAYGKDLFVYKPDARLEVSLIYDERQYLTSKIGENKDELEQKEDMLKPNMDDYRRRVATFERRSEEFNAKVEYWGNQGGAPEDEYNKLIQEKDALQTEANSLNAMARSLNQTTQDYNSQVDAVNQDIATFNEVIHDKPEGGIYDPRSNTISIFYNTSKPELVHTIAHELGHAVGIGHLSTEESIMYPETNTIVEPSMDDLAALEKVCTPKKPHQVFKANLEFLLDRLN